MDVIPQFQSGHSGEGGTKRGMNVGFVGLGSMGKGMASNIVKSGFPLWVYDLRVEALSDLVERGARQAENLSDLSANCNWIVLSLPNQSVVEAVLFGDAGLTLTVALCEDDTRVDAPASVIRQILINLIRNAVESLDGNGEVTVRTSSPVWQNGRAWVELEVADNGKGIPVHVRGHLFSPVATTKGKGHSGLGLSIVKQLLDDREGIIACHTGHEGTTFRVLLPAASEGDSRND